MRSSSQPKIVPKVPNIFIKFLGPRQTSLFFSKMSTIRETFKNAQIEKLCPPMLLPMWNLANAEAFKLRQKKMATRTVIRGTSVQLLAKNKGTPGDFVVMALPKRSEILT